MSCSRLQPIWLCHSLCQLYYTVLVTLIAVWLRVASVMMLRNLDRLARAQGGAVYMLNGNHESLNIAGDFRCSFRDFRAKGSEWHPLAHSTTRTSCVMGMPAAQDLVSLSDPASSETQSCADGSPLTWRMWRTHPVLMKMSQLVAVGSVVLGFDPCKLSLPQSQHQNITSKAIRLDVPGT